MRSDAQPNYIASLEGLSMRPMRLGQTYLPALLTAREHKVIYSNSASQLLSEDPKGLGQPPTPLILS